MSGHGRLDVAAGRRRQGLHGRGLTALPRSLRAPDGLSGDDIVPEATWQQDREITIAEPPADVCPWLVQMGHGRAGFSTYGVIEDASGTLRGLIGRAPPKERGILPDYQHLAPGDLIPTLERVTFAVLGRADALMHRKQLRTIKQLAERRP